MKGSEKKLAYRRPIAGRIRELQAGLKLARIHQKKGVFKRRNFSVFRDRSGHDRDRTQVAGSVAENRSESQPGWVRGAGFRLGEYPDCAGKPYSFSLV
jgi:hypothetical protein